MPSNAVPSSGSLGHIKTVLVSDSPNGGMLEQYTFEEEITLSTVGLTTDGVNTIPAGAMLKHVSGRITTTITGSTAVKIGVSAGGITDTTVGTDFGALTAGTVNKGTKNLPFSLSADAKVRVTATVANATAGKMRVYVTYELATPPTS